MLNDTTGVRVPIFIKSKDSVLPGFTKFWASVGKCNDVNIQRLKHCPCSRVSYRFALNPETILVIALISPSELDTISDRVSGKIVYRFWWSVCLSADGVTVRRRCTVQLP